MDLEIKQKWVQELRHGRRRQGYDVLCRQDELGRCYCVMGVLADILDPEGWEPPARVSGVVGHRGRWSGLSHEMMEQVGLDPFDHGRLSKRNDSGWSFDQLADFIEQEVE